MSAKRLHIHSLPLLVLAGAAIAILALPAAAVHSGVAGAGQALLQPAVRLEATDRGFVKVVANRPVAEEKAGAEVALPSSGQTMMEVYQAVDTIGLQIVLGEATE